MSLSPFGKSGFKSKAGRRPYVQEATLRDFSAGLNLVDSDTSLRTNSSVVLSNMHREIDGSISLRWGTKFKWNISSAVTGTILEIVDYLGQLLLFTTTGQIAKLDPATGSVVAIWNTTIASTLPGAPAGWSSSINHIDYTDFKNELVVVNGVDKPILIKSDYTVGYLQDIPTGSNVYVPVGKFTTTVSNYTVIAGIAAAPNDIYISATGASGTWQGDPDPNDGVSLNVATYAPEANSDIRGISTFRNFLLVHFADLTVPLELGIYDTNGNHTPKVSDTIPGYGLLSHRFVQPLAQEVIFADERGAYGAKRNLFGQALESRFLSEKITPGYANATVNDSDGTGWVITRDSFCVHNKFEQRIMFFIKVGDRTSSFCISFQEGLKKIAWSTIEGMDFDAGCLAADSRVYLTKGTKIYQYGNEVFADEDYKGDLMADSMGSWISTAPYTTGNVVSYSDEYYIALEDHTAGGFTDDLNAGKWRIYRGIPIAFDWELPWADINARMTKKKIAAIHFDTERSGRFTCSLFSDRLYRDPETDELTPAVTLDFVGRDADGFGGDPEQTFGGGRRTADERMFGMPIEFNVVKMKFTGSTVKGLKVEAISILYSKGQYAR